MQKALTWHRQCEAAGGLPPRLRKRLTSIASGRESKARPTGGLAPGNVLAREWNGRVYHVEVLEDGFRFDGESWSSLSAIARRITGLVRTPLLRLPADRLRQHGRRQH